MSQARVSASAELCKHMERYEALARARTERTRDRIIQIDPRLLPRDYAFHYCHNWGTPEAQATMRRLQAIETKILNRRDREFERIEHKYHILNGENGQYHWCRYCKQATR